MTRPSCRLSIEFDRPERTYSVGETLRGRIHVDVDAPTRCSTLELKLRWRTESPGPTEGSHLEGPVLFEGGAWAPGRHSYPFELPCPEGPLTQRGTLLKLRWFLDCGAALPGSAPLEVSRDFFVDPPPGTESVIHQTPKRWGYPLREIAVEVAGLTALMYSLIWELVRKFVPMAEDELVGYALLAFAGIVTLILSVNLFLYGASRLALPRLEIHTHKAPGSEALRTTIDLRSLRRVDAVTAKLAVDERATPLPKLSRVNEFEGGLFSEYFEDPEEEEYDPFEARTYADERLVSVNAKGAQRIEFDMPIPDPRRVGWSYASPHNARTWTLELTFHVAGWPDCVETVVLAVRPALPLPRAQT